MHLIDIKAETAAPETKIDSAICCFSGGVDSSYTLATHDDEISHLLVIQGFDTWRTPIDWEENVKARAEFARIANKKLIAVDSNVREFVEERKIYWGMVIGSVLTGMGATLAPRLFLVPSSWTDQDLHAMGLSRSSTASHWPGLIEKQPWAKPRKAKGAFQIMRTWREGCRRVYSLTAGKNHQFNWAKTEKLQLPGSSRHGLYLLDATVVDLCRSVFPWAKFRKAKGAVKIHVGLDGEGYLPEFISLPDGKNHECNWAKTLKLPLGSMVVFDMGFTDYRWYQTLMGNGIYFVTRLKSNAKIQYLRKRSGRKAEGITIDRTICSATSHNRCVCRLHRS